MLGNYCPLSNEVGYLGLTKQSQWMGGACQDMDGMALLSVTRQTSDAYC